MIKTTSLELSTKMKELGFPQESSKFYYLEGQTGKYHLVLGEYYGRDCFAAPTAEEVLEHLPKRINKPWLICAKNHLNNWEVGYALDFTFTDGFIEDKSLAEAAGKMWVYLKEQKLI